MEKLPMELRELLLAWYPDHHRELPWRENREPYRVWLSEVMLQQTRVEAVKGYYARFLCELPTVEALAACDPDRLNKLWEGLGYYSRVRNLQKAAKMVVADYGGVFPQSYEAVRALPGIGDYTAGAICSICFGLPTPAVDGNVLRVLSRVMADAAPITDQNVKKDYAEKLRAVYAAGSAAILTQALMELGATVCVPNGTPNCKACPVAGLCKAYHAGTMLTYPVKEAKKPRRIEEKTVFLLRAGESCAVSKRGETGLLAGLWELPNVDGFLDAQGALDFLRLKGIEPTELVKMTEKKHIFTHIVWKMRCYDIRCKEPSGDFLWVGQERFDRDIALPTAFRMFWEELGQTK